MPSVTSSTRAVRARGGNVSDSVFRASLPASASRSLGCRGCHPSVATPLLRSGSGALLERIGPAAPQSFRYALRLDLGAPRRYYPCLGAGAPQVYPVFGRIVRTGDRDLTHSGLAHGRTGPRSVLHSSDRGAGIWRVLLFCLSSLPWTRRLCQAHSAVGYRRLTCADSTISRLPNPSLQ